MGKLSDLKSARNLNDVAKLLGFSSSGLAYILYRMPAGSKYTRFSIPKRNGELREIQAPVASLKDLQRRLSDLLYDCRAEAQLRSYKRPLSHGFRRGSSIWDNAYPHTGKRFVLNIDLADFFPSINFGRVRGFFIQDRSWLLHKDVATIIAQISCHENELPQGSPSSPIISDLIANILDVKLVKLAKRTGVTYSRYADDITFSTNAKTFPPSLAFRWSEENSQWSLDETLERTIKSAGFSINGKKTRMQVRQSRQSVTGLIVNRHVNVSKEYYKTVRSMCHSLFSIGLYHRGGSNTIGPPSPIRTLDVIAGKISHINYVKEERYRRRDPEEKMPDFAIKRLNYDFLFFKTFVANDRALILTEGKTDNIYLSLAIKHLARSNPLLCSMASGSPKLEVQLLPHHTPTSRLLGLDGGSAKLRKLLERYKSHVSKKYKFRPMKHPVIVLVDNDSGGSGIMSWVNSNYSTCNMNTKNAFYKTCENVYVIKTEELATGMASCIETYFDAGLKSTLVDGRKFDQSNEYDSTTSYGKATFAKRVVIPGQSSIDWKLFQPLLDRINSALSDYYALKAAPPPPPTPAVASAP